MINNYEVTIGVDSFRELVSTDNINIDPKKLFVDKTLFIKDFLNNSSKVLLITRPRRWGKTLILSMLQHFLSKEVKNLPTKDLFNNLKIAEFLKTDPKCQKYFGTHPVIFISFKDLKGENFRIIETKAKEIISVLYKQYGYILQALNCMDPKFRYEAESLYKADIAQFERIMNKQQDPSETEFSLKFLSKLLCAYHGKKVFILIDEYDNAINDSFDKPKTLKKLTDFFSNLFGSCLKGNDNLEKGLITGILRVAKANIFSGLNNPTEETMLDDRFSKHYGFTETEVNKLLVQAGILNNQEIKTWYNGYIVGNNTVYNPWSIMQCIDHNGDLRPYWSDSANPKIIKDLLINKSSSIDKQKIRNLIKYKQAELEADLEKLVSFEDLQYQPQILWSLLLHTGYLTLVTAENKRLIRLPNQEIVLLIKKHVDNWFIAQPLLTQIPSHFCTLPYSNNFLSIHRRIFS